MAAATAALCPDDLRRLLQAFAAAQFRPKDCGKAAVPINEMCCQLFERDTPDTIRIQNTTGELSTSYPLTLVIPRAGRPGNPVAAGEVDAGKLRDLMLKARVARCRARFPVPVILFDGKYVCRSATLSGGPEIYGRSGFDLLFPAANEEEADDVPSFSSLSLTSVSDSSQVCSKVRAQDIHLLQQLGVGHICDLMVEKKKVKFGVYITSSEKADKEGRYAAFQILSLPYPGCEFFRTYRDQGYAAEGLVFDWTQQFVDAVLDVPEPALPDVQWSEYRTWDIIHLTQNYLRLFLRCLMSSDSSLLVHCISGWDRTPLFVSLLRLVLWADGQVHQSLSPLEITFLTLAYDWYLFGHNLNDRLQKGEEILFFCFYFLQFLSSDDFSLRADDGPAESLDQRSGSCTSLTSSSSLPCSDCSYPNTPPTLTNSENGAHFLTESLTQSDCSSSNNSSNSHLRQDVAGSQTTPVPIPAPDRRNSCKLDESWQFVSETGSIKDSPRGMPFNSPDSQDSISSAHMLRNGLHVSGAESSPRVKQRNPKDEKQMRRQKRIERLQMVRSTFYNAYSAEIGHRLKNGSDAKTSSTGLSLLYQHFGVGCPNGSRLTAHP